MKKHGEQWEEREETIQLVISRCLESERYNIVQSSLRTISLTSVSVRYDWLIDYIYFTSREEFFYLCGSRHHHCRWRAAKFMTMLDAQQGIWAGRDLYRTIPAVTRGPGFSILIRRITSFGRLLRHARGYGGFYILTRILTGIVMTIMQDPCRKICSNLNIFYRDFSTKNCLPPFPHERGKI
jgi:hypothetical protein